MEQDYSKIYEYESMGKVYAGEKACISLTSWKARINTVSKTLYSLLKQCPGFHIVLVLSKDEFPLMEKELPDNLMLFAENKLIELFWIKPNFKSFKKVLFTMDKYRDVPVISADDDCIYRFNYAQRLYDVWLKNKNCIITAESDHSRDKARRFVWSRGPATLFRPYCFLEYGLKLIPELNRCINDDAYLCALKDKLHIRIIDSNLGNLESNLIFFHDTNSPLSKTYHYSIEDFEYFRKVVNDCIIK